MVCAPLTEILFDGRADRTTRRPGLLRAVKRVAPPSRRDMRPVLRGAL
jgi:hypothetical protein